MLRKYWVIGLLAGLVALDWYIRTPDARSRELTAVIESQASEALKAYPYQFRVLRIEGATAYLSTPRNVEVPAFKALAALHPGLDTGNPDNPAFIAAQRRLADVQSEARAILLAQPGIKEARWELDRDWLAAHSIDLPQR